jgi:hypothetical protein
VVVDVGGALGAVVAVDGVACWVDRNCQFGLRGFWWQ